MAALLDVLFAAAWLVVGFCAARYVARSRFRDPRRADAIAAIAGVFLASGAVAVERGALSGAPVSPPPPAAVAPVAAPQRPAHTRDVSAACANVKPLAGGGFGALDGFISAATGVLSDGAQLSSNDWLTVVGWAADHSQNRPARAACLVVDGHVAAAARSFYGGLRPDVAAMKKSDAVLPVSYSIIIKTDQLGRGTHELRTAAVSQDGSAALLVGRRTIVVK
jgi:hypothetical protein